MLIGHLKRCIINLGKLRFVNIETTSVLPPNESWKYEKTVKIGKVRRMSRFMRTS